MDLRNEIRRALLLEHLEVASQRLADGEHQINRQKVLIADLTRAGQDASPAESFLGELKAAQVVHLASRDRIERELKTLRDLPL
ncbi:MAG TPA: hypothetical protein VJM31_00895 [Vicinamibacterales bacterium]|nr:hypothetical protein [Vicinamibacterales bacterium]